MAVTKLTGAGVVVLVGPTAVGKSRLALQLAEVHGGIIVSADSRQVYRYMDVGTAKPSGEERARVPHAMIDLVQPGEPYSAQRYREEGARVLRAGARQGRPAFVTGGTGFYIRALLDGLALPGVPPDERFRAEMRAIAEREGAGALHARLLALDPASGQRIHPRNVPRIIRALEIVHHLGGPVPSEPAGDRNPALYLGLTMDRATLDGVADRRVLTQIEAGLVEEAAVLLEMGYDPTSVALSGFGYRETIAYLLGRCPLDAAIRDYQAATRRYIRRQLTWFRADSRIRWFDPRTDVAALADVVARYLAAECR